MATKDGNNAIVPWDEVPMIDRVSETFAPLECLNPARLSSTQCLACWSCEHYGDILLLHEQGNRTYLRGRNDGIGLNGDIRTDESVSYRGEPKAATLPAGQYQERELEELHGKKMVQVEFSDFGSVYILMEDGTLYSSGWVSDGQLGRPDNVVPSIRFGVVPIDQTVRRIAAGGKHVLAMTTDQVFVFGSNSHGQLGVPGCGSSLEPRAVYTGSGPAAPHQVVCGHVHSVILTAGGQVLTCGMGSFTGQGHSKNVHEMCEVPGLRGLHVQQVGSMSSGTYALTDGVIYGWGYNCDGRLGVGHKRTLWVLDPTIIDCGGRHITTIRCASELVIAISDTGDCLFWGCDRDGAIIMSPQLLTGHPLPRDVCGRWNASGGLVFLDSKENHGRVFPVLHTPVKRDDAVDVQGLQDAKTEASDIPELKRLLEESTKRENAASEALGQSERDRESLADKIDQLQQQVLEVPTAQQASSEQAQTEASDIPELKRLLEESMKREDAASEALRQSERERESLADRIDQLQQQVLEVPMAQQASSEQDVHGGNAAMEALRQSERDRQFLADRIDQLQQQVLEVQTAQQASSERGVHRENVHQQRTASDTRIAELEKEISELRLEKREQSVQFRSATVDYRELLMEYNSHLESCGATPMRGARSVQQNRRGTEERRGPTHPTAARQGRH